jgi:TonB family protein
MRTGWMRSALGRSVVATGCVVLAACGEGAVETSQPVPMPDPTPIEYPVSLWDSKVQGETEVLIHVNQFGDVDSVLVSKASGYAEFDSAAISGARRLRFTPGKRGDRHVAMWTKIPVRFAQDSTATLGGATASGVQQ